MNKATLRRADLVFSYVLMIISICTILESIVLFFNPFGRDFKMVSGDTIKQTILKWYESPALMPFLLGFVLLFLATKLRAVAVAEGAKIDFLAKEKLLNFIKQREVRVATTIIVILLIYVFALIPKCRLYLDFFTGFQGFPFMVATFLSMLAQMIIFNKKTVRGILMSVLVAAIAAGAITYGFGTLALIPLP